MTLPLFSGYSEGSGDSSGDNHIDAYEICDRFGYISIRRRLEQPVDSLVPIRSDLAKKCGQ